MGKKKKGKVVDYKTDFKGGWFDPLKQNQTIQGVFVREFATDSDFKNTREDSDNFGKKKKSNYEIKLDGGGAVNFSESSGPLQALLDDLTPGDRVDIQYLHLALPDGTPCPKTVTTKEAMWKWRGGKKESSWPVWKHLRRVSK